MKLIRESKTSNIVAYHTHQGFGDLISCSPIVNYLSRANPSLKIVMITRSETYAKNIRRFCYPEVEVAFMTQYPSHQEADPRIEVGLVDSWANYHDVSLVRSGFDRYRYDDSQPWDKSFYENAGVLYEAKSTHFHLQRDEKKEKEVRDLLQISKGEKYAFVHDDPQRGLVFTPETSTKIVKNAKEVDIADMACVLEGASELHMMGSSLLCLADLLGLPHGEQELYYYTFRGNLNARGKEKWKIVSS